MSVLFITRDLGVVAEMANRVIVMYAGQIVENTDVITLFTNLQHPYTKGLLGSTPRMSGTMDKLNLIPGTVPSAGSFPFGCRFADRCSMAQAGCRSQMPDLRSVSEDHQVRCLLV